MKLKGVIVSLLLLALPLCGCSVDTAYDEAAVSEVTVVNGDTKAVLDRLDSMLADNQYEMSQALQSLLAEEFEVTDSVEFVQHSNGRQVQVYRSEDLPGLYVLYDGEWVDVIEPEPEEIKGCDEVYAALKEGGVYPTGYITGGGDTHAIISENEEFALMDFSARTMFSVTYDDVDAYSEDMPVRTIIYCTEGRPVRVEFVYVQANSGAEMTDSNIRDAAAVFSALGLGEESSALAGELADSTGKAGYSRSEGSLTVSSYKNAVRDRDMVYNVFAVDM